MEIQQKGNETLAAYIHHLKIAAKQCAFENNTAAIRILLKDFRMHTLLQLNFTKRTLRLCLK